MPAGRTKPATGLAFNTGHANAAGMVIYAPLLEGTGQTLDYKGNITASAWTDGNAAWTTDANGPGINLSAGSAGGAFTLTDPISGGTTMSMMAWFTITNRSNFFSLSTLGLREFGGVAQLLPRVENATQSRVLLGLSGGTLDLTFTDGFAAGFNSICFVYGSNTMTVYVNGSSVATTGGSGTINGPVSFYGCFTQPSGTEPFGGTGCVAEGCAMWSTAISTTIISDMHANPYSVLGTSGGGSLLRRIIAEGLVVGG